MAGMAQACRSSGELEKESRAHDLQESSVKTFIHGSCMSLRLPKIPFKVVVGTLIVAAAVLMNGPSLAQLSGKKVLTLGAAQKTVAAAQEEAKRRQLAGVIAVVDDGGWPILLLRMDDAAFVASVELAPGKARTAALFKKPSGALEDAINHGRTAAVTARGFIEMQGGLPIVVDGQVVGGIGASFDTPEHDVQIAQAGLAALTR